MSKLLSTLCFLSLLGFCKAQDHRLQKDFNRGRFYIYWGWNWDAFTDSDIHFKGEDYNFSLRDVKARDRQVDFNSENYLSLSNMTIPQYNYRLGYFINENWDLSIGMDHMKYVVQQEQDVRIDGEINGTLGRYDGVYDNDLITITKDFLQFEHTDGLNYANFEIRHTNKLYEIKQMRLSLVKGFGGGLLIPKTNSSLLGKPRYDAFHISGYGLATVVGLNFNFYNRFFIQTEFKGGFIDMPDIRTTPAAIDRASQHFYFAQINVVLGAVYNIGRHFK
ncbi:MAG: hypothetical protein NXI09_04995 [Bacteroidetes bacterium]|nr:hypothetical protein [Bacteroidota bacterium]